MELRGAQKLQQMEPMSGLKSLCGEHGRDIRWRRSDVFSTSFRHAGGSEALPPRAFRHLRRPYSLRYPKGRTDFLSLIANRNHYHEDELWFVMESL